MARALGATLTAAEGSLRVKAAEAGGFDGKAGKSGMTGGGGGSDSDTGAGEGGGEVMMRCC